MVLKFVSGTLVFNGENLGSATKYVRYDNRINCYRARACDYAKIVLSCRAENIDLEDNARDFKSLDNLKLAVDITPRAHQVEALTAWQKNQYRGVVALPTGSGKTILAILAMARLKRSTLVLVPTIDLLVQWVEQLGKFFATEIGMLGGGSKKICDITVSTYDSALIHMEFIGNKFAFLIADECHHLPANETKNSALMSIAPYRLGLSATPELPIDREKILHDLMGHLVCNIHIDQLAGKVLSPYKVETIKVELSNEDAQQYKYYREIYINFLRNNQINFRNKSDWGRFLGLCARSNHGREAFKAFLQQRRISRSGENKILKVGELLSLHKNEQIIVFTADNDTAYELGRRFKLPVLTHQTKAAERKDFLECFRSGKYKVLLTSKVLNEGIDVPTVGVGIILSGSGSVREHVQRLGRILRPAANKQQALLYELISSGTSEENVSARRRDHRAYK